jgi:hypothetical protein
MTEMSDLLDRAVSEPPRLLDPDRVLHRARRRRRARRSAVVTVAAVALVLLVPATAQRIGTGDLLVATRTDDVPPVVSALDDSPTDGTDPFAADRTFGAPAEGVLVHQETEYPDRQVWLVDGPLPGEVGSGPDDSICIVTNAGGSGGSSCFGRDDLLTERSVFAGLDQWDTYEMVVVLPDGYTRLTSPIGTVEVRDNTAVVLADALAPGDVVVSGPTVPTVTWGMDDIWGPGWVP